ncbi:hypothetical protein ACQ4PT_060628 [Festuca glaucescens]
MGSAEDEFTPLSQLTDETGKCKVRVRISRIWESFNPKNNIFFGLDSLLIDDQGETMQARVLPNDIELFEERLVEGKVYALSNFTVEETNMSCSNEWIMYFGEQTVVNEIEGDIDSTPLHSFEFVNFKDLRSRRDNNSLMTDVLGHIVHVGKLQKFKKKSRHIQTCDAAIRNLSGRELSVTLFGDIACGFSEDILEKGLEASVVAVFAGMCVDSSHLVCSTASSKYYLDLDIPEVQDFCMKLRIQQANPVPKKSEAQKLAESWRTIEQLKGLDPEEYDDDTKFLCRVSLIDIDCTSGWCYPGCEFCDKSLGKKYRCSRCGPVKKPIQMYKLKAKVRDNTGRMNLIIFCEVAEELVGVSAEKLVDEIEEDDDFGTPCQKQSRIFLARPTPSKYLTSTVTGASRCGRSWIMLACQSLLPPLVNARWSLFLRTVLTWQILLHPRLNAGWILFLRAALPPHKQGRSPLDSRSRTSVCEGTIGPTNGSGHSVTRLSLSRLMHPVG